MNPLILEYIILAIEKGLPMSIELYRQVSKAIAESKEIDAETKVKLFARLNASILPERDFSLKATA